MKEEEGGGKETVKQDITNSLNTTVTEVGILTEQPHLFSVWLSREPTSVTDRSRDEVGNNII